MANLPAVREPEAPIQPSRGDEAIVDLLEKGLTPGQIAAKLAPQDKKRRKHLRTKIRRKLARDPLLQQAIYERSHGVLLAGLPAAAAALTRRAVRGNPRAITLLLEATGFHNPRLHKHEHSGEVSVRLAMPRPVDTEPPVDAEVVED